MAEVTGLRSGSAPERWCTDERPSPLTQCPDRGRSGNHDFENWSLWLDIEIAARTVSPMPRGAGG